MLLTEQEEGAAAGSCKNPLQITTPTGGSCYCPETDNMMECMCACGACVWSVCVCVCFCGRGAEFGSVVLCEFSWINWTMLCWLQRKHFAFFYTTEIWSLTCFFFFHSRTETLELLSFFWSESNVFPFREMFMDLVSVKHQTDTQSNLQSQLSGSCNSNETMLKITTK